jgi:nucleotide-binding universal stress UspA family protein
VGYQKILVTLDGSALAELALPQAIKVAEPGARIHLLSVTTREQVAETPALSTAMNSAFSLPNSQWPPLGASDPRIIAEREAYLCELADKLMEMGFRPTVEALPGNVVETIVSVACEGFDVVIMATHARSGIKRLALGSVAEDVLRQSPCPIILVPSRSPQA